MPDIKRKKRHNQIPWRKTLPKRHGLNTHIDSLSHSTLAVRANECMRGPNATRKKRGRIRGAHLMIPNVWKKNVYFFIRVFFEFFRLICAKIFFSL